MQLLKDSKFKSGFKLKGLNSIRDGHKEIKLFTLTDRKPDWFLCQWNSKYNLVDGHFIKIGKCYSIYDESKNLTVNSDGGIEFELKASKELETPRGESEPWPHLLIEQEILENNAVKDLKKIECSAKINLLEYKDFMSAADKKNYHTVQFVWVITFKDLNPKSESYNSFIWVVLCPYDSRYEFVPLYTHQDMALPNGEFIYSFCGRDFTDKPLKKGGSIELKIDLYKYLDDILASAQSHGFMKNSRKEDLVLNSTNMGFEITGTFDCKIGVENLSIITE